MLPRPFKTYATYCIKPLEQYLNKGSHWSGGEKNHVVILQVDNLNITHENFKLELENSHSEKVEELTKKYESSFSGKYLVFK